METLCRICRVPIPKGRLRAVPDTAFCVNCAERNPRDIEGIRPDYTIHNNRRSASIDASGYGRCPVCSKPINEYAQIIKIANGLVHAHCADKRFSRSNSRRWSTRWKGNDWKGNDFAILKYTPVWRGATPATELILDYKNRKPAAVDKVNQYAIRAVKQQESRLRAGRQCSYIVGIPSHHPGICGAHLLATCKTLVARFDWLQDGTDWLVRTTGVRSASRSLPVDRPTQQIHFETMQLHEGKIERELLKHFEDTGQAIADQVVLATAYKNVSIIMVDDVITTGATAAAARQILEDAGFESVIGLVMAGTG